MAEKLTERAIKALVPPPRGSRLIWDTELTGFALRVYAPTRAQPKGARTFVLSYWHNSIERRVRIGSWPDWSASAARAEAMKLRHQVDRGEDPARKRRKRRKRRGLPIVADLSARNQGPRKGEQSQRVADVHHSNLVALDHTITANYTVESLLSLLMTGDWQSQAQSSSYKRVKLNLGVEPDLARVLSPVEIALACDQQMRGVWKALTRRRRDGNFVYPARSAWWQQFQTPVGAPPAEVARAWQGEAMLQLFDTVLSCQLLHLATMTRRQAEQDQDRYLAKARELELDAKTMVANPECFADKRDERYRRLREAAKTYTDYAHEIYAAAMRMAPLERKHDGRARWIALSIANKFHELFGRPMYGLTSMITSVVLGREVTQRRIRQWCTPAGKAPNPNL
jgi:hypothetical protein